MKFIELARKRFSSRHYQKKEIPKNIILEILEAGRVAPSAANRQPWYFIVVNNQSLLREIHKTYPRDWFAEAPVAIIICGDHHQSWVRKHDNKDHCDIDAAIATDHMTLAATDLGLATCWICNFDPLLLRKTLNLPDHIEPVAILSLGYPADSKDENRHIHERKSLDEIVYWNGFELK